MSRRQSGVVLGRIRTLFDEGRIGTMTDEELLEQFTMQRTQAAEAAFAAEIAFEAMVLRHGPMVLAVCRRVLADPHDVEDAFQATFLILARRTGSIRNGKRVGGWLQGGPPGRDPKKSGVGPARAARCRSRTFPGTGPGTNRRARGGANRHSG